MCEKTTTVSTEQTGAGANQSWNKPRPDESGSQTGRFGANRPHRDKCVRSTPILGQIALIAFFHEESASRTHSCVFERIWAICVEFDPQTGRFRLKHARSGQIAQKGAKEEYPFGRYLLLTPMPPHDMMKYQIKGKSPQTTERVKMPKMLTPKEIALEWGISPKTLRKFLRKDEKAITLNGGETPGKGGRWGIPATSLKTMQKRFDAWNAAKAPKKDDSPESPETPE